jgi:glutamyl-tRNA synthetase
VVRTRFAPSPTGSLHVGNARIAVLNWLFTRQQGGAFILRIEDTDRARNVPGAEAQIARDLEWLGLGWDEGPAIGGVAARGDHGPYRQTERLALYADAAERLRTAGATYDCWCDTQTTPSSHASQRTPEQRTNDDADTDTEPDDEEVPTFRCNCGQLSAADAERQRAEGRLPALRFRVPAGRTVTVRDAVFGAVSFETDNIADFIILRPDGVPTYNFAAVVDDVTMAITHVIRGAGHLSNTPRQLLVYEALGAAPPTFAHIPMVLGPDRQKLSKRHGARAVAGYGEEGYHPDALVNYLSLLSWSSPSGDEVLERERLMREISFDRMGVADVVFDPQKLRWLSAQHFARMPLDELVAAARPFIDPALPVPEAMLSVAIAAVRTHISTLGEVNEQLAAFFPPAPDTAVSFAGTIPLPRLSATIAHTGPEAAVLAAVHDSLAAAEWTEASLTAAVRAAGKAANVTGPALYLPVRLALTGRAHGPPLAAVLMVQGRDRALHALAPHETSGDGREGA